MQNLNDSPVVDIRKIDNKAKLNAYVAKYAGGDAHKFGTSKRYWSSQDWRLTRKNEKTSPPKVQFGFEVQRDPIKLIARQWTELGWPVEWLSTTRCRTTIRQCHHGT